MDALSLIDVSAEDDFLLDLASPPQHPDPPRAAAGTSVVGAGSEHPARGSPPAAARGQVVDPTAQAPERAESPKKAKPKGGVNLRKSLAWDSAFFTSEGVLDTEELGIVNSTFRKSQGSRLLPGIAEELRRSTESTTSTLDSESYVLESLETELFDNVRASIQRTLGKPDKAPAVASASLKTPRATAKAPPVPARKGVDRIPHTQSKIRPPASTSNGWVGSKQRPQVTLKEPAAARVAVSKAAEVKPSSKPPRALPRVATMRAPTNTAVTSGISDKRSSTGGVVNRQAVAKSANSSGSVPSRPGGGTKNNSTSRSGAFSSAAAPSVHSSPMAGGKTKSPTLISKNRTAQRIPIRSSSRSDISKVDTARASRNKSHGEGASPIISPSSSVDSMSSVISGASTASTVGRVSHTSETFSTRSSSLSPSTRKSNDQPPTTLPRPLIATEGQASGSFPDNLKSNIDTANQGNGCKPSGLRRPTPKIGYFDAEKSVEQKAGARVQLQPTKVLFSPLATPNSWIPSSPKTIPASLTFEQEPKSRAAASSQTKASPSLPLRVAQAEVKPSKLTEPEASQAKASTPLPIRVAQTEVKPSKVTEPEASQSKASTPLPIRVAQTEVKPSKVTEPEASLSKASTPLALRALQTEVKPSKVTEHEASQTEALPLLPLRAAQIEDKPSKVMEHYASQTKASASLPIRVPQAEVDLSKVTEHEASQTEALALLSPSVVETEVDPSKVTEHEASQTLALPLLSPRVSETEVEPAKVAEHDVSGTKASPSLSQAVAVQTEVETPKVLKHDAHVQEADPLVSMDIAEEGIPALHQNVQANGDGSSSTVELSSYTLGQQQSETTAAPSREDEPLEVIEHEACMPLGVAQMEIEPLEVIENEACMPQACPVLASMDIAKENIPAMDTAKENVQPSGYLSPLKENILASNQNIQSNKEHMTPVKGNILASHTNVQAVVEMTPMTLLSQKLSSISLGPAAGEATPLTLLAQKLSSISLGDATD